MSRLGNPELAKIMRLLKSKAEEHEASVWKSLAKKLERTRSRRCAVNLSLINRYTEEGETLAVPGKVLGAGKLEHKISVAAFSFSEEAKRKIEAAGGECLTFSALISKNPEGRDLRIIG